MRPQSHLLITASALCFAVVLALIVAIVCFSTAKVGVLAPSETETDTQTAPNSPDERQTDAIPSSSPADRETGLIFTGQSDGVCRIAGFRPEGTTSAFLIIPERSPNGDLVVGIEPGAFYGCTALAAVQIPATVKEIGDFAFANCPNLLFISVSKNNTDFCDLNGVLYTADQKTLIQYPALHSGSSMTLPASVCEIRSMAFWQCKNLVTIKYEGSAEQWEQIRIASKNYALAAASIRFSGGEYPA